MPSDYFWAASPMCCTNDLCGTRRRVEWTHASMSVGGHALPPHPLIWNGFIPPHTHTPPPQPPLPQSSPVVHSAALFAGMKSKNPRSVLLSSMYNVLWPYLFFTNNLSLDILSLCYIVCVCALKRPKIRNRILASCIFIQFRLDQQRTKLCWQTYNTQPLTFQLLLL